MITEEILPQTVATEFPLVLELTWTAPVGNFTADERSTATKDEILEAIYSYREEGGKWSLEDFIDDWDLEQHMVVTLDGHPVYGERSGANRVETGVQLYQLKIKCTGTLDARFILNHHLRGKKKEISVDTAVCSLRYDDNLRECLVKAGLYEQPELELTEMRATLTAVA